MSDESLNDIAALARTAAIAMRRLGAAEARARWAESAFKGAGMELEVSNRELSEAIAAVHRYISRLAKEQE